MKVYNKMISGMIIFSIVMLAIASSGMVSHVPVADKAAHNAAADPYAGNSEMVVTSVSWYSRNSTELPAPGSNGIPLYVTFVSYETIYDANVSLNLSAYKSPFSYTYISGPDAHVRTYNTIPEIVPGHSYTIMQLVNISKDSTYQYYDENLTYKNSTISGNVTFTIPVGNPQIGLITYITNPPVIYQNEKFIELRVYTENTGTSAMRDVNVNITSSYYEIISPEGYSIAYYPDGDLLNFTFYINAYNVTGNAPIYLHIDNNTYTLDTYIHVNGNAGLSISVHKKSLISDTKKQVMTFYLNDTGNKTYLDVQVHMLSPSIISIHVSSSNPLGALTANNITFAQIKPGNSITVTYVVDTSNAPPGNYTVELLVEYHLNNTEETFNKVFTYKQKIIPTVEQQIENTFVDPLYAGLTAIAIIIVISIAAVAVHIRKKARNSEKAEEKKHEERKDEEKKKEKTPDKKKHGNKKD